MGGGRTNSLLGGPGYVCISPSVPAGQSDQQAVGSPVQVGGPDSSRLAQHAMVLGSSGSVVPDTHLSSQPSRSGDSAIQQGTSQESDQSQSSHLVPRAEAIKEQGFSSPVAPQRRSTRTVYEAKWSVFVRWCKMSQVDFRSPSIKQIADFLLHLFMSADLSVS